jgi:hypothetical protein
MIFGVNKIPTFETKLFATKRLFPEFKFIEYFEIEHFTSLILNKTNDSFIL